MSSYKMWQMVSWGKSKKAKCMMVEGDVKVIMPIMTSALLMRLNKNKE
jgi:deoxyhypusine synthase